MAGVVLQGCATLSGPEPPFGLGAGKHRSIKDDDAAATPPARPEPRLAAPSRPAPPPPSRPFRPAGGAESPTCATDSACLGTLKAILASPDRSWVGQSQSPIEYATGTRLFAYRALHASLTCRELALALGETAGAARTFRAPVTGVTPAQSVHVLSLNAQVEDELRAEHARRCRG